MKIVKISLVVKLEDKDFGKAFGIDEENSKFFLKDEKIRDGLARIILLTLLKDNTKNMKIGDYEMEFVKEEDGFVIVAEVDSFQGDVHAFIPKDEKEME
jgi:hypothetical protein